MRLPGPDVTRAIAMWGVVAVNYHTYLNGGGSNLESSRAERIFDVDVGPFSTRFAALFVLMAGVGITLLTNRSRLSGDPAAVTRDRWRLARRGLLLFTVGFFVEQLWPGTILFFYGAYFVIASLLFTLRTRWLALIGASCAVLAAVIQMWRAVENAAGHDTSWMDPRSPLTPGDVLIRLCLGWTHPLLPWMAFVCGGMILGRNLSRVAQVRNWAIGLGVGVVVVSYVAHHLLPSDTPRWEALASIAPHDRGVLYTTSTLAIAFVAFLVISAMAESAANTSAVQVLQRAGQMTLTIYLLHIPVYRVLVGGLNWITDTGLDTALLFSTIVYLVLLVAAAWWQRRYGQGPFERVYRAFGG